MPNTATTYLPLNTLVHIRAFTNASFNQQTIIAIEGNPPTTLTGSGEKDAIMPNGDYFQSTPKSSADPQRGAKLVVTMNYWSSSAGKWLPSQVMQGSQSIQYFNIFLVVAEDAVDNDWNDAVVTVTWWEPVTSRDVSDLPRTVLPA